MIGHIRTTSKCQGMQETGSELSTRVKRVAARGRHYDLVHREALFLFG